MIKIKKYTTEQIAEIIGGELVGLDVVIDSVSTDTREENLENSCFFAISGNNYDGVDYIDIAIEKGAKVIVTEKKFDTNITAIYVKNVRESFLKFASENIGKSKIIAVTGSVGKTSVKELIRGILSKKYKVMATIENHNNEIGVAQTLFSITDEDFCIVEMGMRKRGEIDLLARACKPYISVITNAGIAHLERLGSEKEIFKAKCEVLSHTSLCAVVPFEDRFLSLDYKTVKPIFIGDKDIFIESFYYDEDGIKYVVKNNILNEKAEFKMKTFFLHDVKNSLIAYCVSRLLGISLENIQEGILEFKNCKNRGNIYSHRGITIIDDSYNSSYDGLVSALEGLISYSKIKGKVPYAVLGDMLEIGKKSEKYHKKIGVFARELGVEKLYCYGDFAKFICEGFNGGECFSSKELLFQAVLNDLAGNEVVLIKASHMERFDTIAKKLKERINEY